VRLGRRFLGNIGRERYKVRFPDRESFAAGQATEAMSLDVSVTNEKRNFIAVGRPEGSRLDTLIATEGLDAERSLTVWGAFRLSIAAAVCSELPRRYSALVRGSAGLPRPMLGDRITDCPGRLYTDCPLRPKTPTLTLVTRVAAGGKKWGKKPHGFQPIPADLDLAKTA
jgi:hypothetical protein